MDPDSDSDDEEAKSAMETAELTEAVMAAKAREPGMFVSQWEDDAENVNEWTQEEIASDPAKQLISCAENGDLPTVQLLLQRTDAERLLAAADSDGYGALHRAAYNGHVTVCKALLCSGADADARSSLGWTPLHSAAFWNQTGVVRLLLRAGADPNAATDSGQTPLHLCFAENRDLACAQLLLLHPRLDPDAVNSSGESVLDVARRNTPCARLLTFLEQFTRSVG